MKDRILKLSGGRAIKQENGKLYYGIPNIIVNCLSIDQIVECLKNANDITSLKKFEKFLGVNLR